MAFAPPQLPSDGNRSRLLLFVAFGAFIIFAGALAPRLLTLPSLTNSGVTSEKPAANPDRIGKNSPASDSAALNAPNELVPQSMLVRLGAAVVILVVLTIGLSWYLRRRNRQAANLEPSLLNVAAALPLRHRCAVFLIEVGDKQFLAGVDPNGIQSVLPLPESTDDEPVGNNDSIRSPASATVASIGTRILRRA